MTRPISDLDVPLAVVEAEAARLWAERDRRIAALHTRQLETQLAELRAHAVQHLAERGQKPTPEHWVQWHDFLDIDPDLRGRDYTQTARKGEAS